MKFKLYNHKLVLEDNRLINKILIVVERDGGRLDFTDFHKYVYPVNNPIRSVDSDNKTRFSAVVKFLNYAFFTCDAGKLVNITIEMAQEFIKKYALCELEDDDETTIRSKELVKRYASYLFDFITVLIQEGVINEKEDDLYRIAIKRDGRGKIVNVRVPAFDVECLNRVRRPIFRDIPDAAFRIIFQHITKNHTEILGLVMLSAFAGLRPSEACNVRRTDSPLGPGIIFSIGEKVERVTIDLSAEKVLRSDLISTGGIKKERIQVVPDMFLDSFVEAYNCYMEYLDGVKYESDYGAFTVNKQGKALTYDSYYKKFRDIIKKEIIPIFLKSDNEMLVRYGHTLLENNIAPHIFRHWYTVQLVLNGVDSVGELMTYRGDKSPESSLTYLKDKGDLRKKYTSVNNEAFKYLMWSTEAND